MQLTEPFASIRQGLIDLHAEPSESENQAALELAQIYGNGLYTLGNEVCTGLYSAQVLCHGLAKRAGWWNDPVTGEPVERNDGELIALMHSELSEALEALRKDRNDDHLPHRKGVEVELADVLVRIFDYAGARKLDLVGAMIEKLAYNARRADHTPAARAQADGKKF